MSPKPLSCVRNPLVALVVLALLSSLTLLFLTMSSRIGTPSMAAPLVSFLPLFAFPFLFQLLLLSCFLYLGFGFWIGLIWMVVTVNLWWLGSYLWFWFVVVGFVTMVVLVSTSGGWVYTPIGFWWLGVLSSEFWWWSRWWFEIE